MFILDRPYNPHNERSVAADTPQGMADVSGRVAAQQRGTNRPTPCGCNLAVDTFHSSFTDTIPLTTQAQALPNMQGSGRVRDMREAASLTTAAGQTFASALAQYSALTSREEQLAHIDSLISAWGATSEFGTLQTRAASNGYTLNLSLDAKHQSQLTALEAFNGRGFYKMPWEGASFGERVAANDDFSEQRRAG